MYSFTRVVIGPKLARMLMVRQERRQEDEHERDAVDADLVLDPEEADPADLLDELEALDRLGRTRARARCERTKATAETASAAQRMADSRSPGMKASTNAPTSGAKMTSERMSSWPMSIISAPAR